MYIYSEVERQRLAKELIEREEEWQQERVLKFSEYYVEGSPIPAQYYFEKRIEGQRFH